MRFSTNSSILGTCPESASQTLLIPVCLFDWEEVADARKGLRPGTASGPDGLAVQEMKKIPTGIFAHIFNKWLVFKSIPEEHFESSFYAKNRSGGVPR